MPITHDATTAQCHVFTLKEGMLSAIAHDLRLSVGHFTVRIEDDQSIEARFEARSLRVDCAMKQGHEDFDALRSSQKREIEDNVARSVLHARRHPEIVFRSTRVTGEGSQREIEGMLVLHGTERHVRTTAMRQDDRWVAEVRLHQPDFGIEPYSAMLGTLKIQPAVRVRFSMPA